MINDKQLNEIYEIFKKDFTERETLAFNEFLKVTTGSDKEVYEKLGKKNIFFYPEHQNHLE